MTRILTLFTASALAAQSAWACGGFFCNNQGVPIEQNAERILFAVDEDAGTVETHVQIFYEGPADEFAWIVPVPANPEVSVTTDRLFAQLSSMLAPRFILNVVNEDGCETRMFPGGQGFAMNDVAVASSAGTGTEAQTVSVSQAGNVGPYEMVVVQAETEAELLDWLQANNYNIPDNVGPALAPYVAQDAYFLALRLRKNVGTGSLTPIAFTYPGDQASVPIQLTSIAASDDMRVEAYILGKERAVPESYLHVEINEASIDWWNNGDNYYEVITQAADEAGGQAFATDYSGGAWILIDSLMPRWLGMQDVDLTNRNTPDAIVDELRRHNWTFDDELLGVLKTCMTIHNGVSAEEFADCPSCYTKVQDVDGVACDNAVQTMLIDPLQHAEALFERHPTITRLSSSMSANEMTVDPVFVFNPDMPEVSALRFATETYRCGSVLRNQEQVTRELELSDGRMLLIPSVNWLERNQTTEAEILAEQRTIAAQRIAETRRSGDPTVLADFSDDLAEAARAHNRWIRGFGGGCQNAPLAPSGLLIGLLGALGLARRRR